MLASLTSGEVVKQDEADGDVDVAGDKLALPVTLGLRETLLVADAEVVSLWSEVTRALRDIVLLTRAE